MARLWKRFDASLAQAGLVDRAGLYAAAEKALPSATVGSIVICGLDDPPPAAAAFLEARRHHPFALVLEPVPESMALRHARREKALVDRLGTPLVAGESEPKNALQRLQQRLFAPAGMSAARQPAHVLDPSVQVLSAAGESLEACGDRPPRTTGR